MYDESMHLDGNKGQAKKEVNQFTVIKIYHSDPVGRGKI